MEISNKQRRWLRTQAHHLKPVVLLGQHGLTEAVMAEIEIALDAHELIKLKLGGEDREGRTAMIAAIAEATGAEPVQQIGHTASFYRANPQRRDPIVLPMD